MKKTVKILIGVVMLLTSMRSIKVNAQNIVIDNNAEKYTVSEGTRYWECSEYFGNGRNNVVKKENPYVHIKNKKIKVRINGYAIINRKGEIKESYFKENENKIKILLKNKKNIMVHINGVVKNSHRLGWVQYKYIRKVRNNNEKKEKIYKILKDDWLLKKEDKKAEKTAQTLRKQLKKDDEKSLKSYVLADFSGSMFEFYSDVLKKLKHTSGEKYIFAEKIKKYEKRTSDNLGGATDIANALNFIFDKKKKYMHIYLLSDLNDNCDFSIKKNKVFKGEITIVYYQNDYYDAKQFFKKVKLAYPNAKINGF